MAHLRPPFFVRRIFNPIAMRFGISGSERLTVTGRRTGRAYSVPVLPVEHGGARYLVSPRGETDWVRNVRASGTARLGRHGRQRTVRVTEIPVPEREPILTAYRAHAGRAVAGLFRRLPEPADHPTFRVEPAD